MNSQLSLICLIGLLAGCGGGSGMTDGAAVDADGGIDGAAPDADETDASADAAGTDAAPPPPCDTEGEMRLASCGNCGMRSETCTAGSWTPASPCIGEGECAAASVEMEATARCGERTRLCSATCTWGPFEMTAPDGACAPGERRAVDDVGCPGGRRREVCSDTCAWDPAECVDECGDVARTLPRDAAEVCVPGGPFVRGRPGSITDSDSPEAEITLSPFYAGTFPVTNERYAACTSDGACTPPEGADGVTSLEDPTRGRFPVQNVTWFQAVDFCTWDGGRRLLTEAEWEKLGRGPAPRRNLYPWGDTVDCAIIPLGSACGFAPADRRPLPDVIDAWPRARSYYEAHLMIGGGEEWVSDWYGSTYYGDPASLGPDPMGPADGEFRVQRGRLRFQASGTLTTRDAARPLGTGMNVIRCARDGLGSE